MEFIVKHNVRWDNGYFYRQMSLTQILDEFCNDDGDIELDEVMEKVMDLNVGNSYTHHFFMSDTYTFRRVV